MRLIVSNPEQTGPLDPESLHDKKVKYRQLDIDRRIGTNKEYTEFQVKKVMKRPNLEPLPNQLVLNLLILIPL